MKKNKEFTEIKKQLVIIKATDAIIARAFELYREVYPEYSADALALMIAEESGCSRATVWAKTAAARPAGNIAHGPNSAKLNGDPHLF